MADNNREESTRMQRQTDLGIFQPLPSDTYRPTTEGGKRPIRVLEDTGWFFHERLERDPEQGKKRRLSAVSHHHDKQGGSTRGILRNSRRSLVVDNSEDARAETSASGAASR